MCTKMINANDGFLKSSLNWGVYFNITLSEEMCARFNQNSSLFYGCVEEAIESRFCVQSTFEQESR